MKDKDALDALRQGDYETASHLLADVVRDNGYSSDVLNHAYTIALDSADKKDDLAEAAFEIGKHYQDAKPSLALDYFQRSIFSGLDPDRVRGVCEYQARLTAGLRKNPPAAIRTEHVAHVIGCFLPGHAPSLYIQLMSKALKQQGIRSTVFTTEWASDWFFNPPGQQSQAFEVDGETIVGPRSGGFLERAEIVATAIRDKDIDIAFYHCGPTEQITVRVAALGSTPVQINVNHATEVDADIFDGFAHLFQNGLERNRFPHRPSRWIPLISDIEERLTSCVPRRREELDLERAETVSGTYGNLFKVSPEYVQTLVRIMERFPGHYAIRKDAPLSAVARRKISRQQPIQRSCVEFKDKGARK